MPHIGYALCIVFLREGMHLELSIPILYANKPVGTLSIEQDGLYTVYTGACAVPELRSLRLSVYGEDSEAYLGLMVPDGEGVLSLRKRLTRLERERLPDDPLFAAEEHAEIPERENTSEDMPAPDDVLWHAGTDGTLYAVQDERAWLAIPEAHADLPPEARRLLREIDGGRYLVFPR